MAQKIINGKTARDFTSSATAEAHGFRLIDWLRAFTFNDHAARIDTSNALPKWWEACE